MGHQAVIEAVLAAEAPARPDQVLRSDRLLPLLHEIQHRIGHVPDEAVAPLARRLNLSRAEVHGVISYYRHFRRAAPGRHVLQLCQAEACQSMGADALREHAEHRLGCRMGERGATSADGSVTLEPVYCLGQCAAAPAMMIDDRPHARITPERFDAMLAELLAADERAGREAA